MHASDNLILITLLVKLGVAAAVASSLARSTRFKRLLLRGAERTRAETMLLVAWICVPLTLGVLVRVRVPNFLAADLSFEGTTLLALVFGPPAALVGAVALALPAVLHREYFALAVNLSVAAIFGTFRRVRRRGGCMVVLAAHRPEHLPLDSAHGEASAPGPPDFSAGADHGGAVLTASLMSKFYPTRYFEMHSQRWLIELAICACAPVVVGIPLKIWNAVRIEHKLEEQSRLLLEARLDALQRQINPHFLFNTLNSIASLVRSRPELAREMIVKLGNILRALLREREAFVPLGEELAFTDDYLDIEVVRFGEKLRVVKEIAEDTLEIVVPSMLLQPLIENSIKHGLEPRISGGTVTLRSRLDGGRLMIEVEDDGVGVEPGRTVTEPVSGLVREGSGIGMTNVRERMQVLYGDEAAVEMVSRPGRGTRVRLSMPVTATNATRAAGPGDDGRVVQHESAVAC